MLCICLVALIGLPAAGKTTISNWLLYLEQNYFNVIHVCFDDFFKINDTESETSIIDYKTERNKIFDVLAIITNSLKLHNTVPVELKNKIKCSNSFGTEKFVIICDDNNFYSSMRYKLYQFCKDNILSFAQIHLICTLEESLIRNQQRITSVQVPNRIVENMAKRFEIPGEKQFHWEENTLHIKVFDVELKKNDIIEFLLKSFDKKTSALLIQDTSNQLVVPNTIHQLDLILRRHIKELLQQKLIAHEKQREAELLNAKRKNILQTFKKLNVKICDERNLLEYVKLLQ